MKLRLLILLAGLLVVGTPSISEACGYGSFGSAKNISNPDIAQYKLLCDYGSCGLAMDNDGAWGAGCGFSKEVASSSSIGECQKHSKNPDSCKVVDINGESDFIKGGGSQRVSPAPRPDSEYGLVSTGTGFIVNPEFVVTADHVLRKNDRGDVCDKVSIVHHKDEYEAKIITGDPANDLGLIKLSKPINSIAKLRNDPDLRLGETAVNYGYPLTGKLSSSAKITSGSVNSLAGYNNNSAFLQYDAASQFGNSGGPVLDASGNIIGVVSAKLDDSENQLVNFATKSTILEGFLKANKVPFEKADLTEELKLPDIAEKAEAFTVLVGCWE